MWRAASRQKKKEAGREFYEASSPAPTTMATADFRTRKGQPGIFFLFSAKIQRVGHNVEQVETELLHWQNGPRCRRPMVPVHQHRARSILRFINSARSRFDSRMAEV